MGELKPGMWSMIGTYFLIATIGFYGTSTDVVIDEFVQFFTGNVANIAPQKTYFFGMLPTIFFVITFDVGIFFILTTLIGPILGNPIRETIDVLRQFPLTDHLFFNLFGYAFAEEVVARWFFLSVLRQTDGSHYELYGLIAIGNGIWSLFQLLGYRTDERSFFRFILQFMRGIFFSYLYLKYGLIASCFAHFAGNAIFYSFQKRDEVNLNHLLRLILHFVYAGFGYVLMVKPITDVRVWFEKSDHLALPEWTVWDYLVLNIFVGSALNLIFDVLLYDDTNEQTDLPRRTQDFETLPYIVALAISTVFALGLLYACFYLFAFVIDDIPLRALCVSVVLTSLMETRSLNGTMRQFWVGLPTTYLLVCTIEAIDVGEGFSYVVVLTLIVTPFLLLKKRMRHD